MTKWLNLSFCIHFSPSNSSQYVYCSVCVYNVHVRILKNLYWWCLYCHCPQYMGSTPIILTGNASAKSARMQQAQQVVKLFKVQYSLTCTYTCMYICVCIYMYIHLRSNGQVQVYVHIYPQLVKYAIFPDIVIYFYIRWNFPFNRFFYTRSY